MADSIVAGSNVHGIVVEAVLSTNVADQTMDQGVGFLVADTPFGVCSTIVENFGRPILVQSQLLVGSNLNIPISEMGCGLINSEVPRLIWDDSLSSDKGEEAVNPEVITPLALWDPNGFLDLISVEDGSDGSSVEEVLEPSEWVRRMIRGFSTFMGFPIASCERQCIDFFQKLKRA